MVDNQIPTAYYKLYDKIHLADSITLLSKLTQSCNWEYSGDLKSDICPKP